MKRDGLIISIPKLRQMDVEPSFLQTPVSVSVNTAREQGETVQALGGSGFAQVCAALQGIVDPARAYKQRKPAEVMLHYLEENVLSAIASHVQPALSRLGSLLRQALPELPGLLERYAPVH